MKHLTYIVVISVASAVFAQTTQPVQEQNASASFARAADADFARSVDLERFRLLAVQHQGRLKTFDTLSREVVQEISGKAFLPQTDSAISKPVKLDPVYVYLDLLFRPEKYSDARLYYVKKRPVRIALAQAAAGAAAPEVLKASVEDGRFSLGVLTSAAVRTKIDQLHRDVMRTAKDVEALQSSVMLSRPSALKQMMRVVPPVGSQDVHEVWNDVTACEILASHGASGMQAANMLGLPADTAQMISTAWQQLGEGWRAGDAKIVNAALNRLSLELPLIAPAVYPAQGKLELEHWYYKYHKMTWVWVFYLGAVVFLLMGIVYAWRWAKRTGLVFFAIAFSLHTVASGIRWYLAGRIPNSNMFEAITAAAWFGAAVALILEAGPWLARRRHTWTLGWVAGIGGLLAFLIGVPMQGVSFDDWQAWGAVPTAGLILHSAGAVLLIALVVAQRRGSGAGLTLLGASVAGMVAMMCGQFLSVELHSDIGTRMPVLNDLWLYIHTNMIIASYALIGIAFVTAAMYIVGRMLTAPAPILYWTILVPALVIPLARLIPGVSLGVIMPAWAPFLIVVACTLVCLAARGIGGRVLAQRTYPALQGAPGMMTLMPSGGGVAAVLPAESMPDKPKGTPFALAGVLDGATMVLMELFFVMLWTGIIMGAVWADHSWGRPWGWDPKEVFALNTWIIFLILVHVRLRVREKALWTAVLVVIGTSVMLFNWVVVNFFITGLHSYA